MRTMLAFMRKEWMEDCRTGKLLILGILFVLFGLMNPAIAKMTPFLMKNFVDVDESVAEAFIKTADVSMSWTQFYKNIPMALIVCIILMGGILTKELSQGTLIPVLTKGLKRWKIVLVKGINLLLLWTVGYWCCYGITYFYNEYYWGNETMSHLFFPALCYWMFGVFFMSLIILFSSLSSTVTGVYLGLGGVYAGMMVLGICSGIRKYLPTKLLETQTLLSGGSVGGYVAALGICAGLSAAAMVAGCLIFRTK